jgi:hypothetical protein
MCRVQCRSERLRLISVRKKRHRRDSKPCGQSPMEFKSISLAARTQCLDMKERSCATKLFHVHLASKPQAADIESHSMPTSNASQSIQINTEKATLRSTSTGCLVWWYDSRFGCEKSQVQFLEQPFVRYAARQGAGRACCSRCLLLNCWSRMASISAELHKSSHKS